MISAKVKLVRYAGIGDAPSDGQFYARKDGVWALAPSSGTLNLFTETFDNTNLVNNELTINHTLGRMPLSVTIYNPSGRVTFAEVNATTTTIVVNFNGGITGTPWRIVYA